MRCRTSTVCRTPPKFTFSAPRIQGFGLPVVDADNLARIAADFGFPLVDSDCFSLVSTDLGAWEEQYVPQYFATRLRVWNGFPHKTQSFSMPYPSTDDLGCLLNPSQSRNRAFTVQPVGGAP